AVGMTGAMSCVVLLSAGVAVGASRWAERRRTERARFADLAEPVAASIPTFGRARQRRSCPLKESHRMSLPIDEVTARTPCPPHYGGETHHFPFTRNGKPVIQPGPDSYRFGGARPVLLALCFSVRNATYLVPPSAETDPPAPLTLCPACVRLLNGECRAVREVSLAAVSTVSRGPSS
ncbi:MAG: hypothetical protein ACRDRL_02500, partial [Sciscionella sp.]